MRIALLDAAVLTGTCGVFFVTSGRFVSPVFATQTTGQLFSDTYLSLRRSEAAVGGGEFRSGDIHRLFPKGRKLVNLIDSPLTRVTKLITPRVRFKGGGQLT